MSYLEEELKRATGKRSELFQDPGGGIFECEPREYVLLDQDRNIWEGVREDALDYFKENSICFWESVNKPTGHLLSSQIACINHLFFMRQRQDVASEILKGVDRNVKKALRIEKSETDCGYVVFAENGQDNYLNEASRIRGGRSTSIDAAMLGEMKDGSRKLFLIKWNYAECYCKQKGSYDLKSENSIEHYQPLLENVESPMRSDRLKGLIGEPFFQLMRETLLAHEMVKANEYGATEYLYLHVAPFSNRELMEVNASAYQIPGQGLRDTWTNLLKTPGRYQLIDPRELIEPAEYCTDTKAVFSYLRRRYWH